MPSATPNAFVAQRIEHLTTDQKVGGSSPSKRTNKKPREIGAFLLPGEKQTAPRKGTWGGFVTYGRYGRLGFTGLVGLAGAAGFTGAAPRAANAAARVEAAAFFAASKAAFALRRASGSVTPAMAA